MAPNVLLCERTCFSKGCDDVYEKAWGGVCGVMMMMMMMNSIICILGVYCFSTGVGA